MSIPLEGDEFSKLIEHLRKAQESCAMLAHLAGSNDRKLVSNGWLQVSEGLKKMQRVVIAIASGKMH